MPERTYSSQRGDLFIDITVRFPTSLTEEQKKGC